MKVVYIAGPFTAKTPWEIRQNINRAEEVAFEVAEAGFMPLCPHTNTGNFIGTKTSKFWYEGTLELMRRCDAVLVLPGYKNSVGTRSEINEAARIGLPVFLNINDLALWAIDE